jgi:hypothetical protein
MSNRYSRLVHKPAFAEKRTAVSFLSTEGVARAYVAYMTAEQAEMQRKAFVKAGNNNVEFKQS